MSSRSRLWYGRCCFGTRDGLAWLRQLGNRIRIGELTIERGLLPTRFLVKLIFACTTPVCLELFLCHRLQLAAAVYAAAFPQPHASAAAVLGDELDAGRFEGGLNCSQGIF